MAWTHKRRWIISDLRDRYSVAAIARRRGVSEEMARAIWADWSAERKRESDRRRWMRKKLVG